MRDLKQKARYIYTLYNVTFTAYLRLYSYSSINDHVHISTVHLFPCSSVANSIQPASYYLQAAIWFYCACLGKFYAVNVKITVHDDESLAEVEIDLFNRQQYCT